MEDVQVEDVQVEASLQEEFPPATNLPPEYLEGDSDSDSDSDNFIYPRGAIEVQLSSIGFNSIQIQIQKYFINPLQEIHLLQQSH